MSLTLLQCVAHIFLIYYCGKEWKNQELEQRLKTSTKKCGHVSVLFFFNSSPKLLPLRSAAWPLRLVLLLETFTILKDVRTSKQRVNERLAGLKPGRHNKTKQHTPTEGAIMTAWQHVQTGSLEAWQERIRAGSSLVPCSSSWLKQSVTARPAVFDTETQTTASVQTCASVGLHWSPAPTQVARLAKQRVACSCSRGGTYLFRSSQHYDKLPCQTEIVLPWYWYVVRGGRGTFLGI